MSSSLSDLFVLQDHYLVSGALVTYIFVIKVVCCCKSNTCYIYNYQTLLLNVSKEHTFISTNNRNDGTVVSELNTAPKPRLSRQHPKPDHSAAAGAQGPGSSVEYGPTGLELYFDWDPARCPLSNIMSKLGTKSYFQTYDILKERAAHKVNVRVHGKLTSLSGQLLALWQYIRDQMYCPVDILPPPHI